MDEQQRTKGMESTMHVTDHELRAYVWRGMIIISLLFWGGFIYILAHILN